MIKETREFYGKPIEVEFRHYYNDDNLCECYITLNLNDQLFVSNASLSKREHQTTQGLDDSTYLCAIERLKTILNI